MGRYAQIFEFEPNEDGKGLKIGIVMSRFNIDICEGLLSSCKASLVKHGVGLEDIRILPDMDGRDRVVGARKPGGDSCGCA